MGEGGDPELEDQHGEVEEVAQMESNEELEEDAEMEEGESEGSEVAPRYCVPGNRLSVANNHYLAGHGTYTKKKYIYASLAGLVKVSKIPETNVKVVTVHSPRTPGVIPRLGDIVTCKVTVVNSRQVNCVIICVGASVLLRTYRGIIKKEDIRQTDRDRVDPYKCYRPGDIILARVLPITEIHWYYLTTAENDLGVVIATADGAPRGTSMVPLSWAEMQCPETLVKEPRKVAQVLPEKLELTMFTGDSNDDEKLN